MKENDKAVLRAPHPLWWVLAVVLSVASAGLVVAAWQVRTASDRWAAFVDPQTHIEAERAAVLRQLRQSARLETAVMRIEQQVVGQRGSEGSWSWVGERLAFTAIGEVSAGIDLSAIDPTDIWLDSRGLHLRVPSPQIFRVDLDENASRVDARERGWFGWSDPNLETQARRRAVVLLEESARERGLLDQASTHGDEVLTGLLGATTEHAILLHH